MAITAKFEADFNAFVAATNKAEAAVKQLEAGGAKAGAALDTLTHTAATGFFADLAGSLVTTAAGFVSAQAVIGAFTGVYHDLSAFVSESIKAFADAETAEVKLIAALRQHSVATPEVIAQYLELGTTFQRTTIYADDQIQAMEALLTQVGGIMPSAMKGALKASTDLAAGLGIDLHSATTLVAKAAAGHTETLGRYGITVSAAALETKGFDAVLEAVNRQFGGQAAAAIETYGGKVAQIGNAWNNVQESVGKFVVQNAFAVKILHDFEEATTGADKAASGAAVSVAGFAKAMNLPGSSVVLAALEGYIASLNTVDALTKQINAIPNPFEKMGLALPPITAGLKLFDDQLVEDAKLTKYAAAALATLNDEQERWDSLLKAISASMSAKDKGLDLLRDKTEQQTAASLAEYEAQVKLNAAWGLDAQGALHLQDTALDTLNRSLTELHAKKVDGISQEKQEQVLIAAYTKAMFDAAIATDTSARSQVAAIGTVVVALNAQIDAAFAAAQASAAAIGMNIASVGSRPGEGPGINGALPSTSSLGFTGSLGFKGFSSGAGARAAGGPVSGGSSYMVGEAGPELFTPGANGFITPRGGGATVINHIYVNGTAEDVARKVAEQIIRTVKQGTQFGAA